MTTKRARKKEKRAKKSSDVEKTGRKKEIKMIERNFSCILTLCVVSKRERNSRESIIFFTGRTSARTENLYQMLVGRKEYFESESIFSYLHFFRVYVDCVFSESCVYLYGTDGRSCASVCVRAYVRAGSLRG